MLWQEMVILKEREKAKEWSWQMKWEDIHAVTPSPRSDPYGQYWPLTATLPDYET